MVFLISLALTALLIVCGKGFLKKHATVCYLLAAAVSAAVVICTATGAAAAFPAWVRSWIWPIFARSALSTALFAAVMYAGAVPNGSTYMKTVMPIRGELSIIASILTLGHNISFGMTYFRLLFTEPSRLPLNQLLAAVCSLLMLCIMLPLFITSFKCVRKKMKGSSWKKLQRLAYGFYALIYVHVLLLTLPAARKGGSGYLLTVIVYSIVFLTYGAMRAGKALKNRSAAARRVPAIAAACVMVLVLLAAANVFPSAATADDGQQEPSQQDAADPGDGEEPDAPDDETDGENEDADAEDTQQETPEDENKETPAEQPADGKSETPAEQPTQSAGETQKPAEEPAPAQPQQPAEPEKPSEPEVTYQYKNGTFTGSGEGFEGTITVSVTIENDKITDINVISSSDDEPYWSEGKGIISRILAAQSADVDTVSGATFSSTGIRNAVKAALSSAKN